MRDERFARQASLIPLDRVKGSRVMVIGIGSVGRHVATQLVSIGVSNLILIDPDQIETVNLGPQGYSEDTLGEDKVEALAYELQYLRADVQIETYVAKFGPEHVGLAPIVFIAVDSITDRRTIWRQIRRTVGYYCDGRMLGETIRVLTVGVFGGLETEQIVRYEKSFFPQADAEPGLCTATATGYSAAIAAGIMVSQFAKWLRGAPLLPDVMCDIAGLQILETPITV